MECLNEADGPPTVFRTFKDVLSNGSAALFWPGQWLQTALIGLSSPCQAVAKFCWFRKFNAVRFQEARAFGHLDSAPFSATMILRSATEDGCNLLCVQYRTLSSAAETYVHQNGQMNGYLHTRDVQPLRYAWRVRFARKTYRLHSSITFTK